MSQYFNQVSYGLSQALINQPPFPIYSKRAPTVNDIGYQLATMWIFIGSNQAYVLTSVINKVATWVQIAAGGTGTFSSLTVTPGPISLTGTTSINTSGAAVTTIGTGGTGAVNIGNATGNTAVTGSLATTTSISAGTFVNAATTVTAVAGNITAINGNVVINTAGKFLQLPGANVYAGAGAPAGGLATEIGDMYINTTAASATTRLYIATAVGTWTNVTCAG
jgi:hypothetical protein